MAEKNNKNKNAKKNNSTKEDINLAEETKCNCTNEECIEESYCECENCDCKEVSDVTETCRESEFKEHLQRLQAEFDNYRKRNEFAQEKYKEDGIVFAIGKLLPVLDSFKSAKMQIDNEEFLNSLDLIEKQFNEGLKALNIEKIDAENMQFNPNYHNAVLTGNEQDIDDNEILEVYQDGYKLNNRIIRHSVVKINKLN